MYAYKTTHFPTGEGFAPPAPPKAAPLRLAAYLPALLVLTLAALAIRAPHFGDPNLHVDETFYLHTADLMLNGAVPYIDIWDRKPIGLFLLYAAIRLLGGDGILQYQLVATGFAIATAFIIALIARRSCGWQGACAAGIAYLAGLSLLGGHGGQSPVFYNLFIAAAGLLTLQAAEAKSLHKLTMLGTSAMLLCGLAIQVKYPALVEGCFFGLVLVWLVWSRMKLLGEVLKWGIVFALCGIGPTAAVLAVYAAMGHLEAFLFANFTSIALRPPTSSADVSLRLISIGFSMLPLLAAALAGVMLSLRKAAKEDRAVTSFTLGWLFAAAVGFVLIGTFYRHYALPLLVPLGIAAAPLFDRHRGGVSLATLVTAWSLLFSPFPGASKSQAEIASLTATVKSNLKGGCLFLFDAPPVVHHLTQACYVTPYVFAYHLNAAVEQPALGVDTEAEMRRLLARRPTVIVGAAIAAIPPNTATTRILYESIERNYRLAGFHRVGRRTFQVYALK